MEERDNLDVASWTPLVSNGYPALEVISAPANLSVSKMPEQRQIERVLNFARSRYQWTVLDLGCSLTPYTMSMLQSINELYLVASPDVLSLYQVKQILKELQENDYSIDRLRLILNRSADYEDRMICNEAQRMLGITTYFSLPNDYTGLAEAYATSSLLPAHSPLSRQISALTSKISGIDDQDNQRAHSEPWYRKFRKTRMAINEN
jgi:pilus assembly protein CpaE